MCERVHSCVRVCMSVLFRVSVAMVNTVTKVTRVGKGLTALYFHIIENPWKKVRTATQARQGPGGSS